MLFRSEWNDFRKKMLVCCFRESWNNFLMWSHYANSYNGICIEYNTHELLCSKRTLLPVVYTDILIDAKDYLCKEDFYDNRPALFYKAGIYAVISKHSSWSYENEWRLVQVNDSISEGQLTTLPLPNAVYFGHKVEEYIKNKVIGIA